MRFIFIVLIISILFLGQLANGQITLTAGSYTGTFVNVIDSFFQNGTGSIYTAIAADTNAIWDVSPDVVAVIYPINTTSPANITTYPASQWGYPALGSFAGFYFTGYRQRGITAVGYREYGDSIFRQPHSTTATTGGAMDSLIIDSQLIVNTNPLNIIQFPASYLSNWSSNYIVNFSFHLDIASHGFVNTPGLQKKYLAYLDTVVGWGKMKVKSLGGATSGSIQVLQVKEIVHEVDSYFVAGTASTTGLGVTQGHKASYYIQYYYRVNEVEPLCTIVYTDSTFSSPSSVSTHIQRLPSTLAINKLVKENKVNIYPNPVDNKYFNIDIVEGMTGDWSIEMVNMAGNGVFTSQLIFAGNETHTSVSFPSSLATGIYFLKIKNNGEQIAVRTIDIQ